MSYRIVVAESEIQFDCAPDTTVLDAAHAAGWELPHSCRRGVCLNCLGKVVQGQVSGEVDTAGEALFCQAKPRSDILILPRSINRIDPAARKTVKAKVYRMTRLTDDVVRLQLRFPAGVRAKFKAGQYLNIILDGEERRSYSMANSPHQNDGVDLHIRLVPGGYFSEHIIPSLSVGAVLKVELPFGDFTFRQGGDEPLLFVASGTGYAPIRSLLLDLFKQGIQRPMTLYWGARSKHDLYALDEPLQWEQEKSFFRCIPVLSEPKPSDAWNGRTGLVHRAVMDDCETLSGHHVYVCGVPVMVNAARADFLTKRDLPATSFFSDVFATTHDEATDDGVVVCQE